MMHMLVTTFERQAISLKELLGGGDPANLELNSFSNTIVTLTNWAIGLSGTVALIYMLWGGLTYLTAGGDDGKTQKGKETITWSVVGFLVIVGAYALVKYYADLTVSNSPLD